MKKTKKLTKEEREDVAIDRLLANPDANILLRNMCSAMGHYNMKAYDDAISKIEKYFDVEHYKTGNILILNLKKYKKNRWPELHINSFEHIPQMRISLEEYKIMAGDISETGLDINEVIIDKMIKHYNGIVKESKQIPLFS
jgi:hypothetical protein